MTRLLQHGYTRERHDQSTISGPLAPVMKLEKTTHPGGQRRGQMYSTRTGASFSESRSGVPCLRRPIQLLRVRVLRVAFVLPDWK